MHEASLRLMESALNRYTGPGGLVQVLDVGSYNINGSYRELIDNYTDWEYTGLDIMEGPNVDIVADNPYHYPIQTGAYDVVISGSVAYAVLDLVSWTKELARVLRPGGLLVVVTPSLNKPSTTQSPVDLWRMTPDAIRLLLENTGVLTDVQIDTAHMDVMGSAIRVHGEIDEPSTSPVVHTLEMAGATPISGETELVTVKPRQKTTTSRKPVKKATRK